MGGRRARFRTCGRIKDPMDFFERNFRTSGAVPWHGLPPLIRINANPLDWPKKQCRKRGVSPEWYPPPPPRSSREGGTPTPPCFLMLGGYPPLHLHVPGCLIAWSYDGARAGPAGAGPEGWYPTPSPRNIVWGGGPPTPPRSHEGGATPLHLHVSRHLIAWSYDDILAVLAGDGPGGTPPPPGPRVRERPPHPGALRGGGVSPHFGFTEGPGNRIPSYPGSPRFFPLHRQTGIMKYFFSVNLPAREDPIPFPAWPPEGFLWTQPITAHANDCYACPGFSAGPVHVRRRVHVRIKFWQIRKRNQNAGRNPENSIPGTGKNGCSGKNGNSEKNNGAHENSSTERDNGPNTGCNMGTDQYHGGVLVPGYHHEHREGIYRCTGMLSVLRWRDIPVGIPARVADGEINQLPGRPVRTVPVFPQRQGPVWSRGRICLHPVRHFPDRPAQSPVLYLVGNGDPLRGPRTFFLDRTCGSSHFFCLLNGNQVSERGTYRYWQAFSVRPVHSCRITWS